MRDLAAVPGNCVVMLPAPVTLSPAMYRPMESLLSALDGFGFLCSGRWVEVEQVNGPAGAR